MGSYDHGYRTLYNGHHTSIVIKMNELMYASDNNHELKNKNIKTIDIAMINCYKYNYSVMALALAFIIEYSINF